MKIFYLISAAALLFSLSARADESITYGCRLETSHGTYHGLAGTKSEAARDAYLRCQDDARNTKWQCYGAWLVASCHDLTD